MAFLRCEKEGKREGQDEREDEAEDKKPAPEPKIAGDKDVNREADANESGEDGEANLPVRKPGTHLQECECAAECDETEDNGEADRS